MSRDTWPGGPTAPQTQNRYAYANNNPTTNTDPSGHFVDTILDIGFIIFDVGSLVFGPPKERGSNWLALGADVAGAVIPFVTGAGLVARGSIKIVGTGGKILEGAGAIRSAAQKFGVDYTKLARYIERELKPGLLGPRCRARPGGSARSRGG